MGYQTQYKIECDEKRPEKREEIQKKIKEISHIPNLKLGMDRISDGIKWYTYPKDMCNISEYYSNINFTLIGYGEAPGDIWKKVYQGGNLVKKYKIEFVEDKE